MADAREDGWIGDLVTVEVQNRQHGAVADRIDELVRMPGGGERPRFGLAVADHAGDDELRIVEAGAVSVREAVTELAPLMDGSGRFRGDMAIRCGRGRKTA